MANTEPSISLIRPVPTQSIAQALQAAAIELPEGLPDGCYIEGAAFRSGDAYGASVTVILKVSDSLNGQLQFVRSFDDRGIPVNDWAVKVQGSIKF